MIVDTLANAELYTSVHPGVGRGLAFLRSFDPTTPDGRVDIDGDDVFALVQSYETEAAGDKSFEAHRVYLDIQFIVEGAEVIGVAPIGRLTATTEYDAEKDFLLFDGDVASTPVLLLPGDFAVLFPEDGHKPGCCHLENQPVRKVVVKVRR